MSCLFRANTTPVFAARRFAAFIISGIGSVLCRFRRLAFMQSAHVAFRPVAVRLSRQKAFLDLFFLHLRQIMSLPD